MAPLSFRLAGIVIDHQRYGEHLNASKKTIDPNLELRNFEGAGNEVASLWHGHEWGGHKIDAKYVPPPAPENLPVFNYPAVDPIWFAKHARWVNACCALTF